MQMAIASDQALCLEGFAGYGATRGDPAPAIFADLKALLDALATRSFSLVVIDLALEEAQPIACLRAVADAAAPTPVVALDTRFNARRRTEVIGAGLAGYLVKTMNRQMVFAGFDLVLAGVPYHVSDVGRPSGPTESPLTDRQVEVLRQLVEGKSNKEIARLLEITTPTVKLHVNQILKRLGARNRTEAAMAGLNLLD
ncbi:response regulator transcription factor [Caulobacter sp. NIBR1757]|uniref:response regulator transcription factor n=1 Tax=Caulobacter sp. NIBR1757 TaxID=3016000 RepID=UPI0022F0C962|nr:response regulator transcription factor [Caulobacter sp. NIBR1757]WGM40958.1 hypothetical protein AMEJIAPC_03905 [Caulobacter sp. NIBR1757]